MLSRMNRRQKDTDAAASLRCSSESKTFEEAAAADATCSEQECPPDAAKQMAAPQDVPVRRRGSSYPWTIVDHLALMTSSVLLMVRCRQQLGHVCLLWLSCAPRSNLESHTVTAASDVPLLLLLRRSLRFGRLALPHDGAAAHPPSGAPRALHGIAACSLPLKIRQADEELFLVAMEHQIAEHKVQPRCCS